MNSIVVQAESMSGEDLFDSLPDIGGDIAELGMTLQIIIAATDEVEQLIVE